MDKDNETVTPEVVTKQDPTSGSGLILPETSLPERLYLLPATNRPFFPGQALPILVDNKAWGSTVKKLKDMPHHMLGLCYVGSEMASEEVMPGDFAEVGCAIKVHHVSQENNHLQVV
ncbi:MAG TPA: endopeptidase La, partial [Gammaproteobacteria bacterium]|nr:endopeptidase La [Gammaproteobacteria bacterium]